MPAELIKYPCRQIGCSEKVSRGIGYCHKHKRIDIDRPSANSRGYNHRWQKARLSYLKSNPICCRCDEAATVVDHVVPHRGDYERFWDMNNWQSLCKRCHDIKTATEDGGFGRRGKD